MPFPMEVRHVMRVADCEVGAQVVLPILTDAETPKLFPVIVKAVEPSVGPDNGKIDATDANNKNKQTTQKSS